LSLASADWRSLKGRADALYVYTEPLAFTNRVRINILAAAARLPTMHGRREYIEAGGLISYGTNFPDLFRRAADFSPALDERCKGGLDFAVAADV
jgi:putative ABC transport system substrate-binding protein